MSLRWFALDTKEVSHPARPNLSATVLSLSPPALQHWATLAKESNLASSAAPTLPRPLHSTVALLSRDDRPCPDSAYCLAPLLHTPHLAQKLLGAEVFVKLLYTHLVRTFTTNYRLLMMKILSCVAACLLHDCGPGWV